MFTRQMVGARTFPGFIVLVTLVALLLFPASTKAAPPKPTAEPIVIGCAVPLKFVYGAGALRSATLAVEEINAAGGVNIGGVKHPFSIVGGDTRDLEPGVPVSEALLVVEKLILDKGAKFFVGGPIRSEATLAAMDLFAKHKAILILGSGTITPVLTQRIGANYEKYKYIFRESCIVGWVINEFETIFASIKKEHGFTKAYTIVQDVEHARRAGDIVEGLLQKMGYSVTGKDRFPQGTTDYSAPLLSAKEKGAQLLFVWGEAPESQILIKQWHALKIPALPMGFMGYIEPIEAWKETDKKCEYAILNQLNAGSAFSNFNPWVVRWWNAYKKRWGTEPEAYCVQVPYTSVYVLKNAIELAGSLDPDKVVTALEKTDMKGTPQGRIRFDKNHQIIPSLDPEEGAIGTMFQWQDGKRVVIFPPKIAVGKIQLPPWMK